MNSRTPLPLVSIVFTSYNHAEFLEQAVESLLNQTYRNFNLIIVDDCSTDGSRDILEKYRKHENVRLHLLDKNTGSYVKASNYGASFADGNFILFAQCDDFAHPTQLETLVTAFDKHPECGVVWSRSNMVDVTGTVFEDDFNGREFKFRKRCKQDTKLSGDEMRRFLSYSCVIPNLSAAMVRHELYKNAGRLSERYLVASDWAFWLTLSELTSFYYITRPLNNFRQHATTIRSKVKIEKQILEVCSIFYDHIREFQLSRAKALALRRGAGFVWFSFIFHGAGPWFRSFSSTCLATFKLDRWNLFFLVNGIMIFAKEVIFNRFKK